MEGSRKQEAGNRKQEAGSRKQEIDYIKRVAIDWVLLIKKLTPTTTGDQRSAPTIVGVNFSFHL